MNDGLEEFVDKAYRTEFERGWLKYGYEAALFCVWNGVAIPDCLSPLVENAIKGDFTSSEGRGRGNASEITESRSASLRNYIVFETDRLAKLGYKKVHAFQMISAE